MIGVTADLGPYEAAITCRSQSLACLRPADARFFADQRNDNFAVLHPNVDRIIRLGANLGEQAEAWA